MWEQVLVQELAMVTHVVDGPQPESHLPVLVLTEDDFPQPWADLCPPDADVCPRHWPHHPPDAWAGGHCHLLERGKEGIRWQEGNRVRKRDVRGRKESRGMMHSNSAGDKKECCIKQHVGGLSPPRVSEIRNAWGHCFLKLSIDMLCS